ncbi:hypothetical protein ACLMJK_007418 [Lecanora helva]
MPAKVMQSNKGLREISHSITGGSISAQGYWVPFEAAKAIAARLCYKIRYVLVPVFGPDFVTMCCKPGDADFENLSIDRDILRRCEEEARAVEARLKNSFLPSSAKPVSSYDQTSYSPLKKSIKSKQRRKVEVESGYGTDTDRSDLYSSYPSSPATSGWNPVNTPRVANLDTFRFPPPSRKITSSPWVKPVPQRSPKTLGSKRLASPDDTPEEEETPSNMSSERSLISPKRKKVSHTSAWAPTPEVEAARTLIQLSMADTALAARKPAARRRRAST